MHITPIAIADAHPFVSPEHCQVCRALFFARSRGKWNSLLERWELIRHRTRQTERINPEIVSAIMTEAKQ